MEKFTCVKDVMKRAIDKGASGNSIAVFKDGNCLYEHYEGVMDFETGVKIGPETLFRIYSMTKVIACAAALMLYERGEFLLEDPVEEYLPAFRDIGVYRHDFQGRYYVDKPASPLLIRHLFSMTSGIASSGNMSETAMGYAKSIDELDAKYGGKFTLAHYADALAATPLAFDPGSHWRYGASLEVLARICEVVTGKSLGQIFKDGIFDPLGMSDTAFSMPKEKLARLCSMYRRAEGGFATKETGMDKNYQMGATMQHASGGLISSLPDYAKFADMLACGQHKGVSLLNPRTIALMAANQLCKEALADFQNGMKHLPGYGYGLGVRTMIDRASSGSNGSVGEFGWYGMAGSLLLVDPAERLSVVYMQQTLPAMQGYMHARIRNAVYASL